MARGKGSTLAVALSCVALGLSGCTKSADTSPEGLAGGLLDITDMPGDWQETQRDVFETRGDENPSIDPSTWCPEASDAAAGLDDLAGDAGADVEMQMQIDGKEIPRLMRLQVWRNDDVRTYFADVLTVLNICDGAMGRTTVARIGEAIMVLQIGDFMTPSSIGELSDDDWREIVQRAADKLADA